MEIDASRDRLDYYVTTPQNVCLTPAPSTPHLSMTLLSLIVNTHTHRHTHTHMCAHTHTHTHTHNATAHIITAYGRIICLCSTYYFTLLFYPSPLCHPSPSPSLSPPLLTPSTTLSSPSLPPSPSIRSTACHWTTVALTRAVCLVCSQPIPCVGGAPLRDAAWPQTAAARPARSPVRTTLPAVLQLHMCHRSKLIL